MIIATLTHALTKLILIFISLIAMPGSTGIALSNDPTTPYYLITKLLLYCTS